MELKCWNCGASLNDIPRPISRHANCSKCFEVLHCCRMCRWYAPGRPGDCDHDRADPPVEKENANFCEFFSPTNAFVTSESQRKDSAKSEFSALFGESEDSTEDNTLDKKERDNDPNDPRSKLDDLFKD